MRRGQLDCPACAGGGCGTGAWPCRPFGRPQDSLGAAHGSPSVQSHRRRGWVHSGVVQTSVRWRIDPVTRGRRTRNARARTRARRRRRPAQVLFRLGLFEIAKLQKSSSNSKISKKKICRGAIDLQLSQRVTYVLINGLPGNVGRSCSFSTA
jgi:hypothetical protein